MNADSQSMLKSLSEYSQQLECRREVLSELADIGNRMTATAREGAIPTLEEILEKRQETIERLERVLLQTRDLEVLIADAARLTSHPNAEVAKAAKELIRSADDVAEVVENILQTQQECERVLLDSIITLKSEQQTIGKSKKLAGVYKNNFCETPRFIDSTQ